MAKNARKPEPPYEEKFAEFLRLIEDAKTQKIKHVIVFAPWTLGDTYEELVRSLDLISEAGLDLHIVPPSEREKARNKT